MTRAGSSSAFSDPGCLAFTVFHGPLLVAAACALLAGREARELIAALPAGFLLMVPAVLLMELLQEVQRAHGAPLPPLATLRAVVASSPSVLAAVGRGVLPIAALMAAAFGLAGAGVALGLLAGRALGQAQPGLVALLGLYAGPLLGLVLFARAMSRRQARLCVALGLAPAAEGTGLEGSFEGCKLRLTEASKTSPARARLLVPDEGLPAVTIRRPTLGERVARRLRGAPLDGPVVAADAATSQAVAADLGRGGAMAEEVGALLGDLGAGGVRLGPGEVEVDLPGQLWAERPARVLRLLGALRALARTCARREVAPAGEAPRFAWTPAGGEARCPYCRDDVAAEQAAVEGCPRCGTLHHAACLEEAGGCTVLGCRPRERDRVV